MEVILILAGFSQKRVRDGRLSVHRVRAGHVQSHRIEGGEEAHIRNNGCVIFRMAVTVRTYVDYEIDVEIGASSMTAFEYSAIL